MKINLLLLGWVFLVSACQNKEQAQVETLEKEVTLAIFIKAKDFLLLNPKIF